MGDERDAAGRLEIDTLFPLAIGRASIPQDPLDLAVQLQTINGLRGEATSNPDSGCAWTGDLNGVWQLDRHPAFAPLVERIAARALAYLVAVGFERAAVALHLQRCWPVVSEEGQVIGRHHHPNAHLSAVYYLNGDGSGRCGCLRFWPGERPNELVSGLAVGHEGPIAIGHPLNAPWVDVAPRAGLLLLFPSRIEHAVLPNEDPDDRRVSISLDFVLTAPADSPPSEYLAPHPCQWREMDADPSA